jgi:PBSX family phage terminase large subunit
VVPGQERSRLDQSIGHLSTQDSAPRLEGLVSIAADFLSTSILEHILLSNQQLPQSQLTSVCRRIATLSNQCRILVSSLLRPYKTTSIVSIEKHSFDWYWDLQVPNLHNYLAGGVIHHNSGKSFIGAHWAREKMANEPKSKGFIGANTYNQLRNATLTTFFRVLDQFNIAYKYNQQRNIIEAAGRTIYAYSLENFDNIRGIEIGWAWLDEVRDTPEEAFKVVMGRLRDPNAVAHQMRLTSSPSGFNWLYDYFVGQKKTQDFRLVQGTSYENPFLPDGYIDSLRGSYDAKTFDQEVLGQFVNTGQGQVYYAFSRDRNVKLCGRDPRFPVMVGMDFNVNPMTAVIFQCIDNVVFVVDEIFQMGSRTETMGEYILKNYGRGVQIIPDSTGHRVTTNSNRSDHEILRGMGFRVEYNKNPARMDRYNVVNNLLEKDRLIISPKCVNLIKDLEQVSFKEGSSQLDIGNDKTLTHISDALGYGCWFCFPIIRPASGVYSY